MYPVEESAHKLRPKKPKPKPFLPRGYQKKKKSDQMLTRARIQAQELFWLGGLPPCFAVNT
jgi:hypothetical protein